MAAIDTNTTKVDNCKNKKNGFGLFIYIFVGAFSFKSLALFHFSFSFPCQELLFACAKDITLNLIQSLDQQKLSFQISSLQIDNQLHRTPYPVILSFNQEYRSNAASQRAKDDVAKLKGERVWQLSTESYCEPVVYVAIATWRKKDTSLVSFEYISLRCPSIY